MIQRRTLFWAAPALAVFGCAQSNNGPAFLKALDVAKTIVLAFSNEIPALEILLPNAFTPGVINQLMNAQKTGYLDLAQADVDQLVTMIAAQPVTDASAAATLDNIEDYLNLALRQVAPILTAVMGSVPGLADAQAVFQDIVLALPIIEIFVNSVLPPNLNPHAASKLASARAAAMPMAGAAKPSADAAYADLKALIKERSVSVRMTK